MYKCLYQNNVLMLLYSGNLSIKHVRGKYLKHNNQRNEKQLKSTLVIHSVEKK